MQVCRRDTTLADLQARGRDLAGLDAEARDILGKSMDVFAFYSPYTGAIHRYSHKALTLEETAFDVQPMNESCR
jgi:hypothetical protein